MVAGDRVLVKDQSTGSQNGIYVCAAGAWSRSTDANSASEVSQLAVFVSEGTTNADKAYTNTTNGPITLGTTSLTFVQFTASTIGSASTSQEGIVELATQEEAEAKSDSNKAVTPASLVSFPKKYAANISAANTGTINPATHGLGATKNLIVQIYLDGSPNELIDCHVTVADNGDVVWNTSEDISGHIIIIG